MGLAPDGWPLILARALAVAGLLSTAGTLAFQTMIAPRALSRLQASERVRIERAFSTLVGCSLATTGCFLVIWSVLEAGTMAGSGSWQGIKAALPVVLARTHFGHLVLLQAVLAAGAAIAWAAGANGKTVATGLALIGVAVEAGHGHAMAMNGLASWLFCVDVVHLLAAACWIGCLAPLLLVVRLTPPRTAAAAARAFSPVGKWCVAGLAGSALIQGWVLVGSIRALLTMTYGWVVLLKIALLGVLFGLAILNRYDLAPKLLWAAPALARRRLTASIAIQTGCGISAVFAAAILSGLVPGMDM